VAHAEHADRSVAALGRAVVKAVRERAAPLGAAVAKNLESAARPGEDRIEAAVLETLGLAG
jgi:hypothetical protein